MELRVFVIGPDGLRRRLICDSVANEAGRCLVGSSSTVFSSELESAPTPDLFLVDVAVVAEGQAPLMPLSRRYPEAGFVLFGTHPDLGALLNSVQVPIRGFLSYNHLSGEEFANSLRVIAFGGAVIEPVCAQMLLDYLQGLALPVPAGSNGASGDTELTEREQEVLALVRQGLGNKEIARHLAISLGTVRAHLRSIFRRLDVTSRAGAAASPKAPVYAARRRLAS
ncbi:MAG TPA: response regulator transcription factor [Dehalococcoidia bacterium]|nr:response regulator transcription factor [Dehalococcoidia bacterium]